MKEIQNKKQREETTTFNPEDKDTNKIKPKLQEYPLQQSNKILQENINSINQFQDRFIKTLTEIPTTIWNY